MRKYTTELLELINMGAISQETVLNELLNWLSESQVESFCKTSDAFSELFEQSEVEEDEDDTFDCEHCDYIRKSTGDSSELCNKHDHYNCEDCRFRKSYYNDDGERCALHDF